MSKKKDLTGSNFLNPDSLVFKTAKEIKAAINDIVIICDLALDPYTTHGHDGIIDEKNNIDNDKTVQILAPRSCNCC